MTGLRRVDSLAARCLLSRGRNKRAMVSRQKTGISEAEQRRKQYQAGVEGHRHRFRVPRSGSPGSNTEMAGRITLRMLARGKQDSPKSECMCAAFM